MATVSDGDRDASSTLLLLASTSFLSFLSREKKRRLSDGVQEGGEEALGERENKDKRSGRGPQMQFHWKGWMMIHSKDEGADINGPTEDGARHIVLDGDALIPVDVKVHPPSTSSSSALSNESGSVVLAAAGRLWCVDMAAVLRIVVCSGNYVPAGLGVEYVSPDDSRLAFVSLLFDEAGLNFLPSSRAKGQEEEVGMSMAGSRGEAALVDLATELAAARKAAGQRLAAKERLGEGDSQSKCRQREEEETEDGKEHILWQAAMNLSDTIVGGCSANEEDAALVKTLKALGEEW